MQVSLEPSALSADPGSTPRIQVKVVNTGTIIDGLSARLIGADSAKVRALPEMLPLFPDAEGQFALDLALPDTQPAGRHPMTVEVVSQTTGAVQHADLEVDVAPRPRMSVVRTPRIVRARRSGRFVLAVSNRGNVALDVTVSSVPADAGTTVRISPSTLRVEPGTTSSVMAAVRGPRMFTGSEVDRTAGLEVVARAAGLIATETEVEPAPALTHATMVQLRQRPLLSRGLLTFLILAAVVLLWAGVFLFGMMNVFKGDPLTKTAPPSFFAMLAAAGTEGGTDGEDGERGGGTPPGTLPKKGALPPGVGAEINGTVTARSDGTPVGRILVEAFRIGPDGKVLVSSGATQSDGTYALAGLFPTSYLVRFTAEGYDAVWYPRAPSERRAEPVPTTAQGRTDNVDVVMHGQPATISGVVDPGDIDSAGRTTVTARLLSSADSQVAARTTTDAAGRYRLSGLEAPGTYEVSFVTRGYAATSLVQQVAGGERRIQPTVLLTAATGQVSGLVSGKDGPLGGATVTTTVGGSPVSVVTPTMGAEGVYTLQGLPTPGTYVVTVAAEGYGTRTEVVKLGAGESRSGLDLRLAAGVGSIQGMVVDRSGDGVGGAQVVVGGVATADGTSPTTSTLTTEPSVGSFAFNHLPVPGDYTLTVTAPGYAPATLPVSLGAEQGAGVVRIELPTELGALTGSVLTAGGNQIVGAKVTATNGSTIYTATSSSAGGALDDGGYLIADLPPGWYSVTASIEGRQSRTALVRVTAGDRVPQSFRLPEVD